MASPLIKTYIPYEITMGSYCRSRLILSPVSQRIRRSPTIERPRNKSIGLIQAIQTLGEVTLSEVIVALNGGTVPAVKRIAPPALAPAPSPAPKPVVATAPAPAPQRVAETPKVSEPKPSPIAVVPKEEPPTAKAPVEIVAPLPAPTHTPEQATATPAEFWKQLVDRVHTERPLVSGWVELGTLLGIEGKVVKMGLPETENSARESLLRPTTKKFLEDVIAELLGEAYQLNVVLDPKLKPPAATELTFGLGFDDAPSKPVAAKEEPPTANPADFYDDPLIQAAMIKFKATLVK
jgi:DNA polymerase-3 subunit gamma/tau